MKFLIIAPRLHNNIFPSLRALSNAGHEVSCLTLYTGKLEEHDGISSSELGFSPLFTAVDRILHGTEKKGTYLKSNFELAYGFPPVWKLFREMRKAQADVVLIKNISSIFSLMSAVYARLLGSQVIFMLQIKKHKPNPKSNSVSAVQILFSAPVVTPLIGEPDLYVSANPTLHYVPFVIEPFTEPHIYFRHDRVNILGVGKFVRRKKHELLIRAFASLASRHIDAYLTIVGERADEAYVTEIQELVKELGLSERVTIKYDLPTQEMLREYEQHDLFVLTSSDEPAAFSPLEAMSRGLAVISSSGNGTHTYIEPGTNGFVFRDGDMQDLIEKIRQIVSDRALLKRFGSESTRLAREKYAPQVFLDGLLRLLGN